MSVRTAEVKGRLDFDLDSEKPNNKRPLISDENAWVPSQADDMTPFKRQRLGKNEVVTISVFDPPQCLQESLALQMIGSNKLSSLAKIICDELISRVRHDDFDEQNHMWVFDVGQEITSNRKLKANHAGTWKKLYDNTRNSFLISDGNSESEDNDALTSLTSHGPLLASLGLTVGSLLRFTYDMGDPIIYNLRVVDIGPLIGDSSKYPALMPDWLRQGYLCSTNLQVIMLATF